MYENLHTTFGSIIIAADALVVNATRASAGIILLMRYMAVGNKCVFAVHLPSSRHM